MKRLIIYIILFLLCLSLISCKKNIPPEALKLTPQTLKQHQIQTRVFDTNNEKMVLSACSELLQDMGFNIDETEPKLGVIVGSKKRSAVNAGQVIGAVLVAIFTGVPTPIDKKQNMRCCIVTSKFGENRIKIHVTFQRIVWDSQGKVTKREGINDPKVYQEFFSKLSKALFLEAHKI